MARLWGLSGGTLSEPGVARDICAEVVPRLGVLTPDLGRIVLVDRSRSLLRWISITDSTAIWRERAEIEAEVGDLVRRFAPVTLADPMAYQVTYARFRGLHGRSPTPAEIAPMRARIVMLDGGEVTSPDVIDSARSHMANFVIQAPGCVASFLFCDPERRALLAASVWADATSAARTAESSTRTHTAIAAATHSTLVDSGTYEVLVYDEPATTVVD